MAVSFNSIAGLIGSTVTALSSILRLATAAVPTRLRFHGVNGTNYVDIQPGALTGNHTVTLPDGPVTLVSGTPLVQTGGFTSAPIVGTGAPVATAHGLGYNPGAVGVTVLGGHNGAGAAGDLVPALVVTKNETNVTVTCTAGATYSIHAI